MIPPWNVAAVAAVPPRRRPRADGDHTLCLSIAGFQDGKSAAEIVLIRSACSDQSRRDCNSQNFRLAVSVASPSSAASISIELWQTSRSRPLSPSTSFMKQTTNRDMGASCYAFSFDTRSSRILVRWPQFAFDPAQRPGFQRVSVHLHLVDATAACAAECPVLKA